MTAPLLPRDDRRAATQPFVTQKTSTDNRRPNALVHGVNEGVAAAGVIGALGQQGVRALMPYGFAGEAVNALMPQRPPLRYCWHTENRDGKSEESGRGLRQSNDNSLGLAH